MPNRSISQLIFSNTRQDTDVLYVVRDGGDYQLPASAMAPAIVSETVTLTTAQVLTLNTTPVQVVTPPPAGVAAYAVRAVIQFDGGSADYATNTTLLIGSTGTVSGTDNMLGADIQDSSFGPVLGGPMGGFAKAAGGVGLSAFIATGNPTTGDRDLIITTYYYLVTL